MRALEHWDRRILAGLVEGLDAHRARGGCCSCPTTPRRCALKTHTTDPVPYLLVDSATDGPGGVYTEPATADCAPVPGHELMARLLATTVRG